MKNIFKLIRKFTVGHNSDRGTGTPTHPQHADLKDIKYLTTVLNREIVEMPGKVLEEQIDTAADIIIYTIDFAIRKGWNLEPYLEAIGEANLRKKFPDGSYRHHSSGKVIKPPNYKPADINGLVHLHLSEGSWIDEPVD